jgi:peptidoglycan hydrolase CwlO-like protein
MYNPFRKKPVKKTYADYVAPLRNIIDDLINYVHEQGDHIQEQKKKKKEIEADISNSETEIANSELSIDKLSESVVIPDDLKLKG